MNPETETPAESQARVEQTPTTPDAQEPASSETQESGSDVAQEGPAG